MSDFTVDRDSTKRVLGKDGVLVSYGTDEPAFEFNADGSYKGLLVEPAATNLCLQSEDFGTTWADDGSSLQQASTEETPDGDTSNKNIKIVDTNAGGTGAVYIYQTITVSADTKYTASVFIKADGLSFVRLATENYDGTTDGTQFFNLSTGALGTTSNLDDSSIEAYPNGWYRCSITWTQAVSDTSFIFQIALANSISSTTVNRDGTSSIFVWGAQVEAGPIATSYIPTTTASVTRAKDDITLGSASSLIGQTAGTLYVEVDWRLATLVPQILLSVSDGTVNNRIQITKNTSDVIYGELIALDNTTELLVTTSASAFSGVKKIAFAYAENDGVFYIDGSSVGTPDTSGDLSGLATLTNIVVGAGYSSSQQANMHIRAVSFFDSRLSNTDLATLTTL